MSQEHIWEKEYREPHLLSRENRPQGDIVGFAKRLRKLSKKNARESKQEWQGFDGFRVLDIGSGTGRNSFYFAELGASVVGLEISDTALVLARRYVNEVGGLGSDVSAGRLDVQYIKHDIGTNFPRLANLVDETFDLALDITSSNSLMESEREICVREMYRLLAPNGILLLKTLCKDGDDNAKMLLRESPGPEKDMYVMPGFGLTERVWTRNDLVTFYERYFTITSMIKKTSYMPIEGRSFKRNFWLVEMKKKVC